MTGKFIFDKYGLQVSTVNPLSANPNIVKITATPNEKSNQMQMERTETEEYEELNLICDQQAVTAFNMYTNVSSLARQHPASVPKYSRNCNHPASGGTPEQFWQPFNLH